MSEPVGDIAGAQLLLQRVIHAIVKVKDADVALCRSMVVEGLGVVRARPKLEIGPGGEDTCLAAVCNSQCCI